MVDFDRGKLFVGGISRDTSEIALRDYFSQYGEVSSSTISKDRLSGIPRGFGFVTFTNPSSAEKALAQRHEIQGRKVEVKKAIPKSEQVQSRYIHRESSMSSISSNGDNQFRTRKIFVGGLSANLTEDDFKGYFEKFGRITDVVLMHDNVTNRPRGFGFITFDAEDVVENILKNSYHELGGKYVEVKRAIPKDPVRMTSNSQSPMIGGRNSPYGGYCPDNHQYGLYPSHEHMSPFGNNGIYNAYQMPCYGSPGFGMPMVARPVIPWNGLRTGSVGPLFCYVTGPGYHPYHMNGGVFGSVSDGATNGAGGTVINRSLDSAENRFNQGIPANFSSPRLGS